MAENNERPVNKADIKDLLTKIRTDFVEPYQDDNLKRLHEISSTTDLSKSQSTPVEELLKLSKLIKAYSTKVGIVCHPEKLLNDDNDKAVFTELSNLTNTLFYFFSLLPLFYNDKKDSYAKFFIQHLDKDVLSLLNGLSKLVNDLISILEKENADGSKEDTDSESLIDSENRLLSIGIIWSACDSLTLLAEKNSVGILSDNIRTSCSLTDDILIDIEEWLEDPAIGYDMLLEAEDEANEELDSDSDIDKEGEAIERIKAFLLTWQVNVKLIRLLLSSFTKSISDNSSKQVIKYEGSALDKLQNLHVKTIEYLDELIADVFMSDTSFNPEEMDDVIARLNETLKQMLKIIKKINNTDAMKSKWVTVWENKYFGNTN
ncbi:hypothetical protein TPHA_0F02700 [Tetrapisispora phaffii CBS 4417]|uniref:Uncharacterized protein n=1 Tax=Tetrapisispora phaffii (strain ATCC 24235 / CBS 4417 / NBRC 1672 / NRRL Y-8282 / UCD 70-5) TaxID=1071381 RepID=G8BUG4_TETPH|nr:hypothetical protein TPHA_0F02700 [Tetrapisispora phaffii CBS 4417]CCE63750.1 hypothetical protein TPHA_0F02700 [Tetrapisispora phaffii CBS 4417]